MKYEVGVNTNCECGESIEEILFNIKAAGFSRIMLSEKGHSTGLEHNIKAAQGIGLHVEYVHLDYDYKNDLWRGGESQASYVNAVIGKLRIMAQHNIRALVMHATSGAYKVELPAPSMVAVEGMRRILDEAEKLGVKIAVENLGPVDSSYAFYLLDNIKSSSFGFCYDCGHCALYMSGDLLGVYGGRLLAVHLHDNYFVDVPSSKNDIHLLPFDGDVDFEAEMKRLAAVGYKGTVMLEIHKAFDSKYDALSHVEFLSKGHTRAKKLAEMVEKFSGEIFRNS